MITKYLLGILIAGTSVTTTTANHPSSSSSASSSSFGVEPTLHAASSLIDIFADENNVYDANFRVAKVLRGMSDSVRGARRLVKTIVDTRKSGYSGGGGGRAGGGGGRALKAWAEGVLGDLIGFVEYRQKLGR